jgi:hypothetical protein
MPSLIRTYSRYRFWKVTFWLVWAGLLFTAGWIIRTVSSYDTSNLSLEIAQSFFIYAAPPIYSAAEYNILGRLMYYLPMHAPLNPGHIVLFFVYLGATVEGLAAAGAVLYGTNRTKALSVYITGGRLLSVSLLLQAVIELVFIAMVAQMHHRAVRSKMLTKNIRTLCIMLYGTSTFVLFRCIARAIESFGTETVTSCNGLCHELLFHDWYLYAFEAAPMVCYTYWLNIVHPGRLLPQSNKVYLDPDVSTERVGPGWIDGRSRAARWTDVADLSGYMRGSLKREAFWEQPEKWPAVSSIQQSTSGDVKGSGYQVG